MYTGAAALLIILCLTRPNSPDRGSMSIRAAEAAELAAGPLARVWQGYRSHFITPEGRVVDNANGGISHSEGQGYAMLLATRQDDKATFERLWQWTQTLAVREDGLFAWAWNPKADPNIQDLDDASDGNLLIAWALVEAARRWDIPRYRSAGRAIAEAVWKQNVIETRFGPTLLPGSHGFSARDRSDGPIVNLSYWVFPAFSRLAEVYPQAPWPKLSSAGLELIRRARFGPRNLPPDWISLADTKLAPAAGFSPVFGYDAIRVPLYLSWAYPNDRRRLMAFGSFSALPRISPHLQCWSKTASPWKN